MASWHDNARFDLFTQCDVYVESPGHYLYVENVAYDYNGSYACCEYQQGTNLDGTKFYMQGEWVPASNEYIMQLEKAPWGIARDVVLKALENYKNSLGSEEERDIVDDAIEGLMDAVESEVYAY